MIRPRGQIEPQQKVFTAPPVSEGGVLNALHPMRRGGVKSFVDDLAFRLGAVRSRAATTLRSVETQPASGGFASTERRTALLSTGRKQGLNSRWVRRLQVQNSFKVRLKLKGIDGREGRRALRRTLLQTLVADRRGTEERPRCLRGYPRRGFFFKVFSKNFYKFRCHYGKQSSSKIFTSPDVSPRHVAGTPHSHLGLTVIPL